MELWPCDINRANPLLVRLFWTFPTTHTVLTLFLGLAMVFAVAVVAVNTRKLNVQKLELWEQGTAAGGNGRGRKRNRRMMMNQVSSVQSSQLDNTIPFSFRSRMPSWMPRYKDGNSGANSNSNNTSQRDSQQEAGSKSHHRQSFNDENTTGPETNKSSREHVIDTRNPSDQTIRNISTSKDIENYSQNPLGTAVQPTRAHSVDTRNPSDKTIRAISTSKDIEHYSYNPMTGVPTVDTRNPSDKTIRAISTGKDIVDYRSQNSSGKSNRTARTGSSSGSHQSRLYRVSLSPTPTPPRPRSHSRS